MGMDMRQKIKPAKEHLRRTRALRPESELQGQRVSPVSGAGIGAGNEIINWDICLLQPAGESLVPAGEKSRSVQTVLLDPRGIKGNWISGALVARLGTEDEITHSSSLPQPFYYNKRWMEALGTIVFYWRHEYEEIVHGPVTFYVFPAGSTAGIELIFGPQYIAAESLLSKNARTEQKSHEVREPRLEENQYHRNATRADRSVPDHQTYPRPFPYSPTSVTAGQQRPEAKNISYDQPDVFAHQKSPQSTNALHGWQNDATYPQYSHSTSSPYDSSQIRPSQQTLPSQNSPYRYQEASRQRDSFEDLQYIQKPVSEYRPIPESQNSYRPLYKYFPEPQHIPRTESSSYGQSTMPAHQQSSAYQQTPRVESSPSYRQPIFPASQQKPDWVQESGWGNGDILGNQNSNRHKMPAKDHFDPPHPSPAYLAQWPVKRTPPVRKPPPVKRTSLIFQAKLL